MHQRVGLFINLAGSEDLALSHDGHGERVTAPRDDARDVPRIFGFILPTGASNRITCASEDVLAK